MFNRLNIKVTPKKGSALLFFPATETGEIRRTRRTRRLGSVRNGR